MVVEHGIVLQLQLLKCMISGWRLWTRGTAGCMMLDLSAAYDLANHDLILKKLELYGFEESSISWMKSYLSSRSQCVYIDGELSDTLQVDVGVPQGSVLGGLLYVLLVGDLPEAIHDHEAQDDNENQCSFNMNFEECGGQPSLMTQPTRCPHQPQQISQTS